MGNVNTISSRIMVSGLNSSGKTTSFYLLKLGTIQTTFITNDVDDSLLHVETILFKDIQFVIYDSDDIQTSHNLQVFFKQYDTNIKALIYIIDSNNRESMDYAIECLNVMLSKPQFQNIALLICANKQDLPNAISTDELRCVLGMHYDTTISAHYLKQLKCFHNIPQDVVEIVSEYTKGRIELDHLPQYKDVPCHIQPTIATGGDGQYEGLDWLSNQLSSQKTQDTSKETKCAIM
eukprot:198463_1